MLKYNLSQIDNISEKILLNLSEADCIFLFGELGAGKTTFARSLINQLQKKNKVSQTEVLSPTFNLLHEYEIKSLKVLHYDLYRLKTNKEVDQLGIFEDNKNFYCDNLDLKVNRLEISFYYESDAENRKINLKGFGKWKNFKLNAI